MGIVSKALGRDDEELQEPQDGAQEEQAEQQGGPAEEQQEPADNPQEEAAEQGGVAEQWGRDKILDTARRIAEEIMYSEDGKKALLDRLSGSQDIVGDVADIIGNVLFAVQSKAKANGRMVPDQTMVQLAVTLIRQLFGALEIMGAVEEKNEKQLSSQILPKAMQAYAAAGGQGGSQPPPGAQPQQQPQPPAGIVGRAMAGGMQ